jgi:hypothetical protein
LLEDAGRKWSKVDGRNLEERINTVRVKRDRKYDKIVWIVSVKTDSLYVKSNRGHLAACVQKSRAIRNYNSSLGIEGIKKPAHLLKMKEIKSSL